MTTMSYRRRRPDRLLLIASMLLFAACGRSAPLRRVSAPAGDGGAVPGSEGGGSSARITRDASADDGADRLGPYGREAGRDALAEAAAEVGPDHVTADAPAGAADGHDGGADQPADRNLEAVSRLDLGRADQGHDDTAPDSSGATGPSLTLVAGRLGAPGDRDGIGGAARFDGPVGIATDGKGTLFVSEPERHVVRKVVVATAEVTTLAGSTGVPGSVDGVGSAASFLQPIGMAYDGAGGLFVADSGNHTIRRIAVASGVVTTVAGAPGQCGSEDGTRAAARLCAPSKLAYDRAGNLFVIDSGHSVLRRVVVATGEVVTLPIDFATPTAVACDGTGKVFVLDAGQGTLQRVDAVTGEVSTLAGGSLGPSQYADGTAALAAFHWPLGLTYDGAGKLFVAEEEVSTVRQVVIATGEVTTLAGPPFTGADYHAGSTDGVGAEARFSGPIDLVSDGAGRLYVADWRNNTIRQVDVATGRVTTLAGWAPGRGSDDGSGEAAHFSSPQGLASDGAGILFVVDQGNATVRKLRIADAEVTTLAGQPGVRARWTADGVGAEAGFSYPAGVASDRKGSLFVADARAIREIAVDSAAVTTLAGSGGPAAMRDGTGTDAVFVMAKHVAYDGTGNLFVTEDHGSTIRKVEIATTIVTTLALSSPHPGNADGAVTTAALRHAAGLACDELGNLFVADEGHCAVYKIALATSTMTLLAGSPGDCGFADGPPAAARFAALADMTSDGAGSLYVSDPDNHAVRRVSIATGAVTTVAGSPDSVGVLLGPLPAGLNRPAGLAYVPGVGLYIADANENAILLARFGDEDGRSPHALP